MTYEPDRKTAYKCAIAVENSDAELRVGSKSYTVAVLDASRDGYTIRVPNAILNRIRSKSSCRLEFASDASVTARWVVRTDGTLQHYVIDLAGLGQ